MDQRDRPPTASPLSSLRLPSNGMELENRCVLEFLGTLGSSTLGGCGRGRGQWAWGPSRSGLWLLEGHWKWCLFSELSQVLQATL